jgi:transposase-like protein
MNDRAVPFHCPYCGEEQLRPHGPTHGTWECRACLRAFKVQMIGLLRPGGSDADPPRSEPTAPQEASS